MPVSMETRVRSSLNVFQVLGVFTSRLRFRFVRKSVQVPRLTPTGKAQARGEEPLGSDTSVSVSVSGALRGRSCNVTPPFRLSLSTLSSRFRSR